MHLFKKAACVSKGEQGDTAISAVGLCGEALNFATSFKADECNITCERCLEMIEKYNNLFKKRA